MKFTAAIIVASSFIGAANANALDLAPYAQKVQVQPKFEKIQVSPVEKSASQLSPSLRAGINELSAGRNMPATKVSSWSIDKDISIGSIIDSLIPIPIMNKIGRGGEVVYIQQFATAEEAAKAKKLCPVGVPFLCEGRSIPTNSKAAKAMRANELISFTFSKTYLVGEDGTKGLFKADAAGEAGYLMKGQFEAQVSKLDANRVRVRILVAKGTGNQSDLDIDAPVEIFSIGTSSLGAISISPYLKIDRQRLSGTIQITDLVFDMSNADAVVGSSRVDLQACKLEYSIVSPK